MKNKILEVWDRYIAQEEMEEVERKVIERIAWGRDIEVDRKSA